MYSHRLFLLAALIGMLVPLLVYSGTPSAVVINELMWMGSDLSTADEWFELVNTSTGSVDISGWSVSLAGAGEEEVMVSFEPGTTIDAGGVFLVGNYDAEHSRLSVEPDLVTSAVSLPNSKLLLRLRDAGGQLIDEVDDGVGAPFAGANPSGTGAKASMERIDVLASGTEGTNWSTATETLGFDEGTPIFGTPGAVDVSGGDDGEDSSPSVPQSGTTGDKEDSDTGSGSRLPPSGSGGQAGSDEDAQYVPDVLISEILSNPKGTDSNEWIELVNNGTGSVNLTGWVLKRGSNEYVIYGIVLEPQQLMVFRKSLTGISLRNNGDTVELWKGSTELTVGDTLLVDSLTYPETAEEVSFGRAFNDPGELLPFCVPTEGALNYYIRLNPQIHIQSGRLKAEKKVTINLEATVSQGSLASATCHWDFGDGEESDKCNPPSHSFTEVGVYDIVLSVESYCGGFREKSLMVEVTGASDVAVVRDESDEEKEEKKEKQEEHPSTGAVSEMSTGAVSEMSTGAVSEASTGASLGVSTSACVPTISSGIVISEIFPSPSDGEEWIELQNVTDEIFELCGWTLDDVRDGGSKPWKIPEGYAIPPLGFLVLTKDETKLALNNGGDDVWLVLNQSLGSGLVSERGTIEIGVTYPKIKKGKSYALNIRLARRDRGHGPAPVATATVRDSARISLTAGGLGVSYCITDQPTPGRGNACSLELVNGNNEDAPLVSQGPSKTVSMPAKQIKQTISSIPLPVKYKNVLPTTDKEYKEDVLTGALASLTLYEPRSAPLPSHIVETGEKNVSPWEVILVIGGVCSSGALMALKFLKG